MDSEKATCLIALGWGGCDLASLWCGCEENPFCNESLCKNLLTVRRRRKKEGQALDFCRIQRLLYHPWLSPSPWDELSFSFQGTSQVFPKDKLSMSFSTAAAGVSNVVPTWLRRQEGWFRSKPKEHGAGETTSPCQACRSYSQKCPNVDV